MKNIVISMFFGFLFCFAFSVSVPVAHAAEEFDVLQVYVPPAGGFCRLDEVFLACPTGTPKPVWKTLIKLNQNGGIEIIKDPQGNLTWIAREGANQNLKVPKGCFLKEEIRWEEIPLLETHTTTIAALDPVPAEAEKEILDEHGTPVAPNSEKNRGFGEGKQTQSRTNAGGGWASIIPAMTGLASFLLFLLISFVAYRMVRRIALHRNPLHPLFQGAMMRTPWWPVTTRSIIQNSQRLRMETNMRRESFGAMPLVGRMAEVYRVNVTSAVPVTTEYADSPRLARPSGQLVHVAVYRDRSNITGVTMGFRFCSNGILFDAMESAQVQAFVQDALWQNAMRLWKADGYPGTPNWAEVENWIYSDLAASVRVPEEPVVLTTPEPVIAESTRVLLAPPAPAEESTSVSRTPSGRHLVAVPEPAAELPATLNLTSVQLKELFESGTARRVTLTAEQIGTLLQLQIPFAFEVENEEGYVVSGLGGKPAIPLERKTSTDPA